MTSLPPLPPSPSTPAGPSLYSDMGGRGRAANPLAHVLQASWHVGRAAHSERAPAGGSTPLYPTHNPTPSLQAVGEELDLIQYNNWNVLLPEGTFLTQVGSRSTAPRMACR